MRIEDRFTVPLPVPDAWKVLIDLERIAPCMPGAQLQEVEGDEYRGVVKVKLGAITAQFKGVARFEEVDADAHRVVLKAEGREIRGQGNASATVTAALVDAGDGKTDVSIDTDLNITGRIAQFGRGIMGDVSSKLLGEFARCLEEDLSGGGARTSASSSDAGASTPGDAVEAVSTTRPDGTAGPTTGGAAGGAAGAAGAAGAGAGTAAAVAGAATGPAASAGSAGASAAEEGAAWGPASTGPRKITGKEAEPVDLLAIAGPSVAERAVPAGIVAVLVLLIFSRKVSRRIILAAIGAGLVGSSIAKDLRGR